MNLSKLLILIIPKQLGKLVFDRVGFVLNFLSKSLVVSISTASRLWQKIQDASLSNSHIFKLFGYIYIPICAHATFLDEFSKTNSHSYEQKWEGHTLNKQEESEIAKALFQNYHYFN